MAVHRELISSGKFDEKFKKTLLNYYNYGFKTMEDFSKCVKTIHDDWERLNNIVSDYLEWTQWKDRNEIMFASVDSQSMNNNPFHRVYRFCLHNRLTPIIFFLHTIAVLSKEFKLREGLDSLTISDEQLYHLQEIFYYGEKLKTSELILFFPEEFVTIGSKDKNKTPNNHLDEFASLGILNCEQYEGKHGGKGDRRWSLSGLTLKKLIDSGKKVQEGFEVQLRAALEFYSENYLLGELGTFICDRFCDEAISPFRFKHDYFIQSLNDFSVIDLIYAIENKKWIKIKYSHETAGFNTELLCFPLEIRVSSMHGREFLIFYEPFHRSYTALRVEFIDSIEFYDDEKIKSTLTELGYQKEPNQVDDDISNSRESLKYSWGVSTTKKQEGNAIELVKPHMVTLSIQYDSETEKYIENRLYRERRYGVLSDYNADGFKTFFVKVSDEVEMRPWIRSFYSRVLKCEGMDTGEFSFESDVESIASQLFSDKKMSFDIDSNQNAERWGVPEKFAKKLGNGEKACSHDLLFNEIFSVYYYIIADVFTALSSNTCDGLYEEERIIEIIRQVLNKYYLRIGLKTEEIIPLEIMELLLKGGFLKRTTKTVTKRQSKSIFPEKEEVEAYTFRYKCLPQIEIYRDIIPLSTVELRWLLSIINDKRIGLFLSEEEINVIKVLLLKNAPSTKPFPMDKCVFFDRSHFTDECFDKEKQFVQKLLYGILQSKTLCIDYSDNLKQTISGEFRPIILEFSKRNNRFQVLLQKCDTDEIFTMNVSQLLNVGETENTFDWQKAENDLVDYRKEHTKSVEIEFFDKHNMADRILMEFSPWKKRCTYNSETKLYRLTIFYLKQDEIDLVVRFLGYGANLRFVDQEHPICQEIKNRINQQKQIIRDNRRKAVDRELGEER